MTARYDARLWVDTFGEAPWVGNPPGQPEPRENSRFRGVALGRARAVPQRPVAPFCCYQRSSCLPSRSGYRSPRHYCSARCCARQQPHPAGGGGPFSLLRSRTSAAGRQAAASEEPRHAGGPGGRARDHRTWGQSSLLSPRRRAGHLQEPKLVFSLNTARAALDLLLLRGRRRGNVPCTDAARVSLVRLV